MGVNCHLAFASLGRSLSIHYSDGRPRRMAARARCVVSEFIPQRELHHTRLCEQTGVITKRLRHLLQRSNAVASLRSQARQDVEAVKVGYVKNFPAELQAIAFPWHLPTLGQRHIQTSEPITPDHVSGAAPTRKWMDEIVVEGVAGISEHAD